MAIIAEKTIDRLRVLGASGEVVSFNDAARILGDVINAEIDNGSHITDEMCERLSAIPQEYKHLNNLRLFKPIGVRGDQSFFDPLGVTRE